MAWSLRDILAAYEAALTRDALEAHRWDMLLYCVSAPHMKRPGRPPTRPPLLDD